MYVGFKIPDGKEYVPFMIHLGPDGSVVKSQEYAGRNIYYFVGCSLTSEGDILFCGPSLGLGQGVNSIYIRFAVVRTDPNGILHKD